MTDTWQEVDTKLERAIYLTQELKQYYSKEDIVDSKNSEIITELKEILSFLRGLNNDQPRQAVLAVVFVPA